ncbi:hypothetical protein NQ315_005705 [Exocentrus adspersus]|uniref:Uncharacterized protein n=1 Tax=Exocentrus adspersus TaxID=1586481 RepID=A0AAV8VI71_9CUCU|nr:hypothetical protein NQ315_005705 [Exocentrus adspersus]
MTKGYRVRRKESERYREGEGFSYLTLKCVIESTEMEVLHCSYLLRRGPHIIKIELHLDAAETTPETTDTVESEENDSENVTQQKKKRKRNAHRIGKYDGSARKNRKRCSDCYKRLQQQLGSKEARAKTIKVTTFCEDCEGQPTQCVPCFKKLHE